MPFYEYRCPACAARFDLQRSIGLRDAPAECPECRAASGRRLISVPIAFAGTDDGGVRAIGGSACGGCTATSCGGCASSR